MLSFLFRALLLMRWQPQIAVACLLLGVCAAKAIAASTEWTNAHGTADWNDAANWSNSAPTSTTPALLGTIGAATAGGKNISAAGSHALQMITVSNSSGNYTIGTSAHQGSFSLGTTGNFEVDSAGTTVDNCDVSATSQLSFSVGASTTVLSQVGDVSSPTISVDGLGNLQLATSSVSFNLLQANGGTTEFVQSLTTVSNMQIAGGATVQLDANSSLNSPSTVAISSGGGLKINSSNSVFGGTINNS